MDRDFYNNLSKIEQYLKQHGCYVLSSVEGKGTHVGRFKRILLDANDDIVIDIDIDAVSTTV